MATHIGLLAARGISALLAGACLCSAAWAQGLDHLAAQAQAKALIARMTVDEKLGQFGNTMPAIPRLGVPTYQLWSEGLHGLWTNGPATIFPQAIGMAATFDTAAVKRMGQVVAIELGAVHRQAAADGPTTEAGVGLNVWSPNLNIFRDPRWGRGQETYGEDPFLTARMGVAYITGVQGPDPDRPRVIATPKHFAVHSGPEPTRSTVDVTVSRFDLEDTYLPAFRAAVTEARAGSVMCAYNRVNGQPACASDYLITQRLRGAWGFRGYLVSDCDAVGLMVTGHKYVETQAEAAAVALKAGLDSDCAIGDMMGSNDVRDRYTSAYRQKLISESDIDRALVRIFTARFELGVATTASRSASRSRPPLQRAEARRAAQRSIVLLKNDGVLPLGNSPRIAVVGPLADSERVLYGSYSTGITDRLVTAVAGIRAAFPASTIDAPPGSQIPGDGSLIPSSALLSEDGRPGLTFRSYAAEPSPPRARNLSVTEQIVAWLSTKFRPEPRLTEVRSAINEVRFGGADPESVERRTWSGFVVPQESGLYRIGLRSTLAKLTFNGEALKSGPSDVGGPFTTQRLESGKRYPINVSAVSPGGLLHSKLFWKRISETPVEDAVKAAEGADVVVAVVGITSDLESEESPISMPGFSHGDRTSLSLPEDQQRLLQALKATGKKLVVVSMSGSALDLAWAQENANAVIQAWYPGQEGGAALGDILAGKVSPSGRLPVTFYKDVAQLPPFDDYGMKGRTYRYFTGAPLYPFGYGLSYTRFKYGPVSIAPLVGSDPSKGIRVSATVTDVGPRDGDEVAQLYLKFPDDPGAPRVALRGFERLHLRKGESRRVTFTLSPRDLGTVSLEGRHQVLAGTYQVSVGGGQPAYADTSTGIFTVAHSTALPD